MQITISGRAIVIRVVRGEFVRIAKLLEQEQKRIRRAIHALYKTKKMKLEAQISDEGWLEIGLKDRFQMSPSKLEAFTKVLRDDLEKVLVELQ